MCTHISNTHLCLNNLWSEFTIRWPLPRVLHTSLLLWELFHTHKHDVAQNVNNVYLSYDLLGGPWPFRAAKVPRPSAVSLNVWLRETTQP